MRRAMERCRSVGTMEPAGSPVGFAGAGDEPARTSRLSVSAEAAIQPEGRRKCLGIVRALTTLRAIYRTVDSRHQSRGGAPEHQVLSSTDAGWLRMKPLAVLIGIVMGSAVSIAAALILTFIVILL